MGLPGKVTAFGLAGLLISLPYLDARYETLRASKAANAQHTAAAAQAQQHVEREGARVAARAQANADAQQAKTDARRALAVVAAKQLRGAMKDPDAFVMTSAVFMPSGAACYEYRGKNSFGATFPSAAMLRADRRVLMAERDGNTFVAAWNKECTKSGGEDITAYVRLNL
jgi:hypothetical protein